MSTRPTYWKLGNFVYFLACYVAFYLSALLGLDMSIQAIRARVQWICQSTASGDLLALGPFTQVGLFY